MERRSWRRRWLQLLFLLAVLADALATGTSSTGVDEETPCPLISPEYRALGIGITEDPSCEVTLDPNSLGCITSHCRLCQAEPTLSSFAYFPCASPPPATESTLPSADCATFVSSTETAAGLSAAKDETCAADSMGCLSSSCRLCRVSNDSAGLDAFRSCAALQSVSITQSQEQETCGMRVSESQATLGIAVVTDSACEEGSPGCLGVCRFCKRPESTVTGLDFCPSDLETPSTSTNLTGLQPATTSETPVCDVTLPEAQQQVGLDIVADSSCSNASSAVMFGCFNPSCRLCRLFDSVFTGDLPGCNGLSTNVTDAPMIVEPTCSLPSPPEASELGLFVVTDETCARDSSSGFGCLSAACRLCKVYDTISTSSLHFCENGQVDLDDEQHGDPTAESDDGASLPGADGEGAYGGVTGLLSASGMVAVVLATALISTAALVGVKRMVAHRSQRQRDALVTANSGHIAV